MNTPPRHEIEYDLKCTEADIARCTAIVENMRLFMTDSGGENRAYLRTDLLRWQQMLDQAKDLLPKIQQALNQTSP